MAINPLNQAEAQNIMGAMDFSGIQELLGELTPNLIPGPMGKFRLQEALKMKFGENFRANSVAREALQMFDQQTQTAQDIIASREIIENAQR